MKTTVIGASAGVGLELVNQLVERGHQVTTLSRSVESIADHPAIHKIRGSSLNADDVARAIDGAEVVLVTLGTGMSSKATGLYPKSATAILQALRATKAQAPLIVLTGFGAGDSGDYNPWLMKLLFGLFLKDIYAEKTEMERMLSAGYPNAMFVRPGRLTNGPLTGQYRVSRNSAKTSKWAPSRARTSRISWPARPSMRTTSANIPA